MHACPVGDTVEIEALLHMVWEFGCFAGVQGEGVGSAVEGFGVCAIRVCRVFGVGARGSTGS